MQTQKHHRRTAIVRGSMIRRCAALVLALAPALTAHAEPSTRDLVIDYIAHTLCFDESTRTYLPVMRFHGAVAVHFASNVPQALRDHTDGLVRKINPIIGPSTTLYVASTPAPASSIADPGAPAIVVYYGPEGRAAIERFMGRKVPATADGYFAIRPYACAGSTAYANVQGRIWLSDGLPSQRTRSILAQELTQVLGPGADADPGALWTDPGDLWRDANDLPQWLSQREVMVLRVLYRDMQGGETHVTTRRIVGESYDRLVIAARD